MRRFIPFMIAMMICLCSAYVYAATGEIQVLLPKEAGGLTFHYTKVAEREELNEEKVKELLQNDRTYDENVEVSQEGNILVKNLEEGIYQIWVSGNEEFEFAPMLVSVPAWDEKEQKMNYQVTVTPKYNRIEMEPEVTVTTEEPEHVEREPEILSPKTGDKGQTELYIAFGMISFIIVMIISCHNRFKCGRMSK